MNRKNIFWNYKYKTSKLSTLHKPQGKAVPLIKSWKDILDQWPASLFYVTSVAVEDDISMTLTILEALQNPIRKRYFAF